MNIDFLKKLPSLKATQDDIDADAEAKAKADRIAFHRERVRNGPVSFKPVTAGQERRARARAVRKQMRVTRKTQVRNYFETQALGAQVRAHLQGAGVLPYVHARPLDLHQQVVSAAWLIERFGKEGEDGTTSYAYEDVLLALAEALRFHGQVIGDETLQVPADYVVPVFEEGTEPAKVRA